MVTAFKTQGDASSGLTNKMRNETPFQEHLLMPGLIRSAPVAPFQENLNPLMTQQVQQVCLEFGFVLPNFNRRREEWDRRGREHTNGNTRNRTHFVPESSKRDSLCSIVTN